MLSPCLSMKKPLAGLMGACMGYSGAGKLK